jgi:hypothetical protein
MLDSRMDAITNKLDVSFTACYEEDEQYGHCYDVLVSHVLISLGLTLLISRAAFCVG